VLKRVAGLIVVAAAAAAARPAFAQLPEQPQPAAEPRLGVDLGVQFGFALFQGRINESIPLVLNDALFSMVPLIVDAGYRADDRIAVGLRFQYGIVQLREAGGGEACGPGVDCRGSATAVAAHVTAHLPVSTLFVPWLRLGGGYEWLRMQLTGDFRGAPADIDVRFRGWTFGLAEVGADGALLPQFAVGPFVGVSVGRYNFGSDSDTPEKPLVYKRVHEWVMFGLRGVFSL